MFAVSARGRGLRRRVMERNALSWVGSGSFVLVAHEILLPFCEMPHVDRLHQVLKYKSFNVLSYLCSECNLDTPINR